MEEDELIRKWRESRAIMETLEEKTHELETFIKQARESVKEIMAREAEKTMFSAFDKDLIDDFFKEPYVTIPKRPQEWYIIAPKFINFQIGWLEKSTASYNVFLVNKFMHWLAQIPADLRDQFNFKPELPVKVYDGMVLTGEEHQDETWNRYKKDLARREGKDRIRVKEGREFHLIAAMIEDGTLPFMPKPVHSDDMRSPPWKEPIELRDYQEEGWNRFLETGAVGVFWPFSAGKTYLGLYAIAHLKGPHLVVVPTRTLKEQWEERLEQHIDRPTHGVMTEDVQKGLKAQLQRWAEKLELDATGTAEEIRARLLDHLDPEREVEVVTYHAFERIRRKNWGLVIYDEAHRLPANTFSRMATIRAAYRMGLSGTPYREDGRTDFIFALTGFPLGMDWHRLLEQEVFQKPDITLYVFDDLRGKLKKVDELLRDPVKTIVFSDSLELGQRIAEKHDIPHVSGKTEKRLEILKTTLQVVVSRVGDEGISLPDIRRVIEVDFLFGSRRQEEQRMGRLFHGKDPGEHVILMTEKELELYEKRLYSIYQKGWHIKIVR